jgi:hypothetical protein
MEMNLENAVRCITAACVLHNFCLLNGDGFDIPLGFRNPNICTVLLDESKCADTRNAIMDHLINEGII